MKTKEEKLEIFENERKLVAIYLREFAQGKLTKNKFIETVARTMHNSESMMG